MEGHIKRISKEESIKSFFKTKTSSKSNVKPQPQNPSVSNPSGQPVIGLSSDEFLKTIGVNSSTWNENLNPEEEVEQKKLLEENQKNKELEDQVRDKAIKYLLGLWKTVLTKNYNNYSSATNELNSKIIQKSLANKVQSEWEPTGISLPRGYEIRLDKSTNMIGIHVISEKEPFDELVHLTIPKINDTGEIHFTWKPVGAFKQERLYLKYNDFKLLGGNRRKSRRRLLKQKRTRRVVRRLIGF